MLMFTEKSVNSKAEQSSQFTSRLHSQASNIKSLPQHQRIT